VLFVGTFGVVNDAGPEIGVFLKHPSTTRKERGWIMASDPGATAKFTIVLTEQERSQLLNWLEETLRSKLIEEHRTESSEYRKRIQQQEAILNSLIQKLARK
jgi:hypothetical protein